MRPLTNEERSLIGDLAGRLSDPERQQLMGDLSLATVTSEAPDGSLLAFEIAGYERPPYKGQLPFPVEARMLDRDGVEMTVLLHADENGRLLELEFVRWDSDDMQSPQWHTLKFQL